MPWRSWNARNRRFSSMKSTTNSSANLLRCKYSRKPIGPIERVNEAAPGMTYPRLLKATGACPPEDVGGAWGYEEFLEALADPDHEQHVDMVHWSGGHFDAEDAGIDSIIERFGRLAKKWAPRPRKPKPMI